MAVAHCEQMFQRHMQLVTQLRRVQKTASAQSGNQVHGTLTRRKLYQEQKREGANRSESRRCVLV